MYVYIRQVDDDLGGARRLGKRSCGQRLDTATAGNGRQPRLSAWRRTIVVQPD